MKLSNLGIVAYIILPHLYLCCLLIIEMGGLYVFMGIWYAFLAGLFLGEIALRDDLSDL